MPSFIVICAGERFTFAYLDSAYSFAIRHPGSCIVNLY